jgi:hypothetical protein
MDLNIVSSNMLKKYLKIVNLKTRSKTQKVIGEIFLQKPVEVYLKG